MSQETLHPARTAPDADTAPQEKAERAFRFYDNRQKYLLFVNTCAEKWAVAERVTREFKHIQPQSPAIRVFDAGVGDGTVMTRVLRSMHREFPNIPFYVAGKEISLEDVRLTLEKMPDRFHEHPATVLVLTNLFYKEAPWLKPTTPQAATAMVWREVELEGDNASSFEEQITALQPFLNESWRTKVNPKTGNPGYERPTVLVIYRRDHKFVLNGVIPKRGEHKADYDLVIASQPYRLRAPLEFKASKVLAPLAQSLRPGGRLLGIHSHGQDPGMEILQGVWPGENPFQHDRKSMLKAVKEAMGADAKSFKFEARSDEEALFKYNMHALPSEVEDTIGTSTLFAAWNAAIYVGQIEDARLEPILGNTRYLEVTGDVLRKNNGLWFWDESYSIVRERA